MCVIGKLFGVRTARFNFSFIDTKYLVYINRDYYKRHNEIYKILETNHDSFRVATKRVLQNAGELGVSVRDVSTLAVH